MSSFALRLPEHILQQARMAAEEDNVSINQILVALVSEGLGHRRALKTIRERAARADMDAARAVLDKAPDVPADSGDEVPIRRRG